MELRNIFFCIAVVVTLCRPTIAQERSPRKLELQVRATLAAHKSQVFDLDLALNGEFLATSSDRETRLWNTTTGQPIAAVDGLSPRFSPDSRLLLTTNNKTVKLWDARTGEFRLTLIGHDGGITGVSFSADGSKVATGSEDGTVRLWDIATGLTSVTLKVWRVKKLPRYRIFSRFLHIPVYVFVKFSPDQQTVLTNTYWEYSSAKLWDAKTGSLQAELSGPMTTVNYDTKPAGVTITRFSPDGKFIVTLSDSTARLWETASGKLIEEFDFFSTPEFSPDSRWLGLIYSGKEVGFLNLEMMKLSPVAGFKTSHVDQEAFSPDSRTYVMASGHEDYHAKLIDVATGRVKAKIPLHVKWDFDIVSEYHKDVDLLSFHPGSEFLMGANHNAVKMWDASTGALVWETTEGRDPAVFSRDGKLLVTVGKDKKTVLIWNVVGD